MREHTRHTWAVARKCVQFTGRLLLRVHSSSAKHADDTQIERWVGGGAVPTATLVRGRVPTAPAALAGSPPSSKQQQAGMEGRQSSQSHKSDAATTERLTQRVIRYAKASQHTPASSLSTRTHKRAQQLCRGHHSAHGSRRSHRLPGLRRHAAHQAGDGTRNLTKHSQPGHANPRTSAAARPLLKQAHARNTDSATRVKGAATHAPTD